MIFDEEVYLEHYGVKGMRWGKRNRALNKASRDKDWKEQEVKVLAARERVKSGETKATYKAAKKQYKTNQIELGTREARKIINEAKDQRLDDLLTARLPANRKEMIRKSIINMGSGIALTALATASTRR